MITCHIRLIKDRSAYANNLLDNYNGLMIKNDLSLPTKSDWTNLFEKRPLGLEVP